MTMDKCGLCKKVSVLKISHLMPKGLYKTVTKTFEPHDDAPVWISKSQRSACYTNKQITKKLLCGVCEDLFNKHGEKYVMQQCIKKTNRFELKKILDGVSPSVKVDNDYFFHPDDCADLKSDKYLYFITSTAWRVTSTDWGNDDIKRLHGALPQEFVKSIKSYLLGETDFPKNIYIIVFVDNDIDPIPFMSLPVGELSEVMHLSVFIPGVKFNIFFGEKADEKVSFHFNKLDTNILFMYRSFRESSDFEEMRRLLNSEVTSKGKLAKEDGRG